MDDDAEIAIIEGLDNVLIDFDVFCSGFELIGSIGDRNMLPKQVAGSFLDFDVGRICGQLVVEPDVDDRALFDGFVRQQLRLTYIQIPEGLVHDYRFNTTTGT